MFLAMTGSIVAVTFIEFIHVQYFPQINFNFLLMPVSKSLCLKLSFLCSNSHYDGVLARTKTGGQ